VEKSLESAGNTEKAANRGKENLGESRYLLLKNAEGKETVWKTVVIFSRKAKNSSGEGVVIL
jgi:hypothetical protein